MENIEFENFFDVYSKDQILSRTIITPSFMDKIVKFTKEKDFYYEFLFIKNWFYIKYENWLELNESNNNLNNDNFSNKILNLLYWYKKLKNIIDFVIEMWLINYSKFNINK